MEMSVKLALKNQNLVFEIKFGISHQNLAF